MSKGLVLHSGGLDSTLALIRLLEDRHTVRPYFVNYGQWSTPGEQLAVEEVYNWCKERYGDLILVPVEGETTICDNEDHRHGSVWGRGLALTGMAAMYAYTHGDDYDFIALGNHMGDVGPDCKPGLFDQALKQTLAFATKGKIDLVLPILKLSTEAIGMELARREVPFEIMYSCYWGPPCGYKSINEVYRCPGCRRKTVAMEAAGIKDKELLSYPNGNQVGRSYQSPKADRVDY